MAIIPILKTESQLKSFISRHTIAPPDSTDFYWDDYHTLEENEIFLDGKKVVERVTTHTEWGSNATQFVRVIALYLPRKIGSSQGSQP